MLLDINTKLKEWFLKDRIEAINLHDKYILPIELDLLSTEQVEKLVLCKQKNRCIDNTINSAVIYCLGLSDHYDFKKTIILSGGSAPDVDQDLSASGRDKVKDYVVSKYGKDYVSGIGTAGLFFPRSAARDVARVMGKDQDFINKFAGLVPDNFRGITPTIAECEKESPQLLEEPYKELWAKVKRIIGLPRSVGSHAAGLLICTDEPIRNNIPLYKRADSDLMITEFDMGEIEELGYVKFDFLGLKNLDVISETLKFVETNHGLKLDLDEIDYSDKKVFDLINSGKLCGIFQLENSLRSITLRVKPESIGDLSAISALGRPGPMDAGLLTQYIENKNEDRKDTGYTGSIDVVLKPILKDTYGVFAYQEQVMKIAQELCGFTLGKADVLRKAIGKKNREAMAKLEKEFIDGALSKGHDEVAVRRLWQQILGFSDYCFNLAHSWAYSVLSYQEAWLKTYYPAEFMAALMTCEDNMEKLSGYIAECKSLGVEVLGPSINVSKAGFAFSKKGALVFGLESIKGLGKVAVRTILGARSKPFSSFEDFMLRVDTTKVNKRAVECLILAGAFDKLGYSREQLLLDTEKFITYLSELTSYEERLIQCRERNTEVEKASVRLAEIDKKLVSIPMKKAKVTLDPNDQELWSELWQEQKELKRIKPLKEAEKPVQPVVMKDEKPSITLDTLRKEKEILGYYLSLHPTDFISGSEETLHINEVQPGWCGIVNGVINSVKEINAKSGKMAFLNIEDATASAEVICFNSLWSTIRDKAVSGTILRLQFEADKELTVPIKLKARKARVISMEL